ncbi:hypothetical protein OH77DRAFT_1064433 [Trametes cingulata]|nr:hypothetical protein OH77DRAFT_1064433 [Trametes cingulata]
MIPLLSSLRNALRLVQFTCTLSVCAGLRLSKAASHWRTPPRRTRSSSLLPGLFGQCIPGRKHQCPEPFVRRPRMEVLRAVIHIGEADASYDRYRDPALKRRRPSTDRSQLVRIPLGTSAARASDPLSHNSGAPTAMNTSRSRGYDRNLERIQLVDTHTPPSLSPHHLTERPLCRFIASRSTCLSSWPSSRATSRPLCRPSPQKLHSLL